MTYIIVDVESDGPIPNLYSVVCFGAIVVDFKLDKTFKGLTKPISEKFDPEALAISGYSRQEHEQFDDPATVMKNFAGWIERVCPDKPTFITDNLAYDWQWINYYFHFFLGKNPFGFFWKKNW